MLLDRQNLASPNQLVHLISGTCCIRRAARRACPRCYRRCARRRNQSV